MSVTMFYHLTRSSPEATMATLLPRALAQGWRVMLRGTSRDRLEALDTSLWQGDDSFLPHGLEGGPHDAVQPVLLGQGAIANAAQALLLVDGAATTPEEAAGLQRVWVLFDGNDPDLLALARGLWTQITGAGLAAQYWSEESGQWQKKSEKPARTAPSA